MEDNTDERDEPNYRSLSVNDLSGIPTSLILNRKQIREAAEDAIREYLDTIQKHLDAIQRHSDATQEHPNATSHRRSSKNPFRDEVSIRVSLIPLTRRINANNNLLHRTQTFIQLYSLLFRATCPIQYNRARAILAASSEGDQNHFFIQDNCFSHMRITTNKKLRGALAPIHDHDRRGVWSLTTSLGCHMMSVNVGIFTKVYEMLEDDESAEVGLILRPNLPISGASLGDKIYIEFTLPYLEEDDISMEELSNNLSSPYVKNGVFTESQGEIPGADIFSGEHLVCMGRKWT